MKETITRGRICSKRCLVFVRALFTALVILTAAFIFSNSAQTGGVSGGRSAAVTRFINRCFQGLGAPLRVTGQLVRKLAHFAEFALLGFFAALALRAYTRLARPRIIWPLCLSLAVSVLDESLQLLIPGRSGQFADMLIDFSGSCTGILVGLLLLRLTRGLWNRLPVSK